MKYIIVSFLAVFAFLALATDPSISPNPTDPPNLPIPHVIGGVNALDMNDRIEIAAKDGFPRATLSKPTAKKKAVSAALSVDRSVELSEDPETGRLSLIMGTRRDGKSISLYDFDFDGRWDFVFETADGDNNRRGMVEKYITVDGKRINVASLNAKEAVVTCIDTDGRKLSLIDGNWVYVDQGGE